MTNHSFGHLKEGMQGHTETQLSAWVPLGQGHNQEMVQTLQHRGQDSKGYAEMRELGR